MIAMLLHGLRKARGQVLGWGLSMAALAWMTISVYDSLAAQQEQIIQLISSYPKELMTFFGSMESFDIFTPAAFLSFEFLSLAPVILGIFAVLSGSGLLSGEEESGRLDLVAAHPVSRTRLFVGLLLSAALATLGILVIAWLGILIATSWSSLDIGALALARPLLSLWAVLMVFLTLALFLSMLLPSRGAAASLGGLLLVASYFVTSMARIKEGLKTLACFSPLNYYETEAAFQRLNWTWLGGLLLAALVLATLAWWQFQRRDIRVGGEAGWKLPALRPWRRRTAE